jgi:hypothetical protein
VSERIQPHMTRQGDWDITPDGEVGRIEIEGHGAGAFIVLNDGVHWKATRLDGVSLEGLSDEPGFDATVARVVVMAVLKAAAPGRSD